MNDLDINKKQYHLNYCLLEIEKKLAWGNSEQWSSYDFEKLSDTIYQETNHKLSANTLKRVWGKLNYDSDPSTTTLNILSQYLGYDDWRNFITRSKKKNTPLKSIGFKKTYLLALLILLIAPLIYILLSGSSLFEKEIDPLDFSFSSKTISNSIPNSVIFEYSTPSYITDEDKLEIQQNWDDSKRHAILNSDSIATSVYYSPGYFMAKLVVNDRVVKEHGLLIPSDGWLGILEGQESRTYLNEDELTRQNRIVLSDSILAEKSTKGGNDIKKSKLYYIKNFEDLQLNDFTIEMVVANHLSTEQRNCPTSSITLYCQGMVILVPLTTKGCISEIDLIVMDALVSGKTNDLSNFGVDMNEDIRVKLTSIDGLLSIFVNDTLAYSVSLDKHKSHSVSGVRYQFEGAGIVEEILIRNKEKVFLKN